MTLLETERLVRRIAGLSGSPPNQPVAFKLAEDFAATCHAANLRLHQCEAMIRAGDRHQAIQLAETAPNLLDWVAVLEFQGSDEWRHHCQESELPVAEAIDARCVEALNECYAQGISTDHPLYAAYRRACLLRDDDEALRTLQTIARLNPSDTNAALELARLDSRVLAARLGHLADLLDGGASETVVAQIEAIEAFSFKTSPVGEIWSKAQVIRCAPLVKEVEELKHSSRWTEALAKLDFIHRVQEESKVQLPADQLRRIEAVESWARDQQEKDKKEKEFETRLSELQYRLQESESRQKAPRRASLPELKSAREALGDLWQTLRRLPGVVPEAVASAFNKQTAALEAEITRQTRIQRVKLAVGSLSMLAAVGVAVWFALLQHGARNLGARLNDAVAHRQFHKAEDLLARAKKSALTPSIVAADKFIKKERALLRDFEEAFAKVPTKFETNPTADGLASTGDAMANARARLDALAPDLKSEHEPPLAAREQRWEDYLDKSRTAVAAMVEGTVTTAEKGCVGLDYRLPPEQVKTQFLALSNPIVRLTEYESKFTNHLALADELLRRLRAVKEKYAAFGREIRKLDDAIADLNKAQAYTNYWDAIDTLASSQFSASFGEAARSIRDVHPTPENALRPLLCGENPRVWNYFTTVMQPDFVPKAVLLGERDLYHQLKNDPQVSVAAYRYRFSLELGSQKLTEWITLGKMTGASIGWTEILAYHIDDQPGECRFQKTKFGFFGGNYSLPPEQRIYDFKQVDECKETAAFFTLALDRAMMSGDEERWLAPLLRSLDGLNQSREGSPLFRAYLFLKLAGLMELQQEESGLWFAPAAREHKAALVSLGASDIKSGDWYAPLRIEKFSKKLEAFFESTKGASYWTQAVAIASASRKAFSSGFVYAGHVGPDARPVVTLEATPAELWGYNAAARSPALLYWSDKGQLTEVQKATALSPLFTLKEPSAALLASAGINPQAPLFDKQLPPLFAASRGSK